MGLRPQALGLAHQRLSQVPRALREPPVLWVLRGQPVLWVSRGQLGQRVQPEPQVLWVPPGLPVQPGPPGPPAPPAPLVRLELRGRRAQLGQRALE